MPRVPGVSHPRGAQAGQVRRQVPRQGQAQPGRWPVAGQVDVGELAPGMHPGIGARGPHRRGRRLAQAGEGGIQLAGDAAPAGLPPPAGEIRAIIGQEEGEAGHLRSLAGLRQPLACSP